MVGARWLITLPEGSSSCRGRNGTEQVISSSLRPVVLSSVNFIRNTRGRTSSANMCHGCKANSVVSSQTPPNSERCYFKNREWAIHNMQMEKDISARQMIMMLWFLRVIAADQWSCEILLGADTSKKGPSVCQERECLRMHVDTMLLQKQADACKKGACEHTFWL